MNLFGTDGIRGIANEDLTCEIAFRLGQAVGLHLSPGKPICVGKDTRISCGMLEAALIAGITSTGRDAICLGVITTPGLSYTVNRFKLGGGVMISASHNPLEYNGLKVFGPDGRKISEETELLFSRMILGEAGCLSLPAGERIGTATDGRGMVGSYVEFLRGFVEPGMSGLRIVVDAANGSASHLAPQVWKALDGDVTFINCSPNGVNINKGCGSTPAGLAGGVRGGYTPVLLDGTATGIAVDEKQ